MAATGTGPCQFKVLYFASASTFTKKDWEEFPAPFPLHQLPDLLESSYPGIGKAILDSAAITLNLEYVDLDVQATNDAEYQAKSFTIHDRDEIAIIPPVSSG